MTDSSLNRTPAGSSPSRLLILAIFIFIIGFVLIVIRSDQPVSRATLGIAYLMMFAVASATFHVARSQERRIAELEKELAGWMNLPE